MVALKIHQIQNNRAGYLFPEKGFSQATTTFITRYNTYHNYIICWFREFRWGAHFVGKICSWYLAFQIQKIIIRCCMIGKFHGFHYSSQIWPSHIDHSSSTHLILWTYVSRKGAGSFLSPIIWIFIFIPNPFIPSTDRL